MPPMWNTLVAGARATTHTTFFLAILGTLLLGGLLGVLYAAVPCLEWAWNATQSTPWPYARAQATEALFVWALALIAAALCGGWILTQVRRMAAQVAIPDLRTRQQHAHALWLRLVRDWIEASPALPIPAGWDGTLLLCLQRRWGIAPLPQRATHKPEAA